MKSALTTCQIDCDGEYYSSDQSSDFHMDMFEVSSKLRIEDKTRPGDVSWLNNSWESITGVCAGMRSWIKFAASQVTQQIRRERMPNWRTSSGLLPTLQL